jgi:hypothetical protein
VNKIAKRIQSHVLEKTIGALMILFGGAALSIFFTTLSHAELAQDVAIIQILLIVVLAILAQTIVLIRIYEKVDK